MLVPPCFNKKVQTSQVCIGSKQHQGEQVTLSTSRLTNCLCASRWCGFSCKSLSNNRRTPGSVKVLKTTCTSNRQGAHHKPLPPVQITMQYTFCSNWITYIFPFQPHTRLHNNDSFKPCRKRQ